MQLLINRISKPGQFLFSLLLVFSISLICFAFKPYIGYKVVAYILLVTVSLIAMSFDILPVFTASVCSALIWDYFFIPPAFTFSIGSTEDRLLLLMYFIISMINAALTYKIRQIEKASRIKEEKANAIKLYNTLLNSLSHELRTPIAAIIGATDNLVSNGKNLTPYNKAELIEEISKASFRLNQQVENLLNMSRLESGIIKPKDDWSDISEIIYDVVKKIEENNFTQRFIININPDIPLFRLDKGMLEQVLYNLLINAGRYTADNCTINIIATCHADMLEIVIEDNGKGFPIDEIDSVFDKFYRLKNSGAGGTGLGLSIVKGFTEAMRGTVELENIDTGGARFIVEIPAETSYIKNLKNEMLNNIKNE